MMDTQQLQQLTENVKAIQARLAHLQGVRASILNAPAEQGLILASVSKLAAPSSPLLTFFRDGNDSVAELRAQNALVQSAQQLIDTYIFQTTHQLQAAEDAIKALCGATVPVRVADVVVTETILMTDGVDFVPSSLKVECAHPLVQRCDVVSSNYVTTPSRATHVNIKVVFVCPLDAETINGLNLPASLSVSGLTTEFSKKVLLVLS